ncbi:MAG: hypothetical protein ACYDH9_20180 [Limisphaerales bacterium]
MRDEDDAYAVTFHLREILAACEGGLGAPVIRRKVAAAVQDFAKLGNVKRGAESLKHEMESLITIREQNKKPVDQLRLAVGCLESRIPSLTP